MKRTARLSRFSVKVDSQLLKNLHNFISRQVIEERQRTLLTNDHISSTSTTKRSIMFQERRTSKELKLIEQQREEDLFSKEINSKKDKYYDIDEINKYKQSMFELPNLLDKNKKIKFKYITAEFIQFLFQILKSSDIIQKIYSSSVPKQSVVNQFFSILPGIQSKTIQGGNPLELNRDDDYYHILIEGASEKLAVKQAFRSSRSSSISQSETTIMRRSKLKNKTVTQKGKIICFQNNMPILANEKQSVSCNLKTIGKCTFLLIDKGIWAKFLMALQKLEEKHLVGFIKYCTTINLNTYTKKETIQTDEAKKSKKKFLHQLKFPNESSSDQEQDCDDPCKRNNQRKLTNSGNSLNFAYQLFTISKDSRITFSNQDIYLIVKGAMHLLTNQYSMIINQGSIINSSILMDLTYKQVQAKSLVECILVKIVLDQIYFTKVDQNEFIAKLKQIQDFRIAFNEKNHIDSSHSFKSPKSVRKTLYAPNQFNDISELQNKLRNSESQKKNKFEPKQLIIKEMSFTKGNQDSKISPGRSRINHCKKTYVQPQSHQRQIARQVALKYANNYCIFQKIVQSEQKVVDAVNINKIKKLFPIKDLFKSINFTRFLQNQNKKDTSKPNPFKIVKNHHEDPQNYHEKQNQRHQKYFNYSSNRSATNRGQDVKKFHQQRKKESLEKLRKRRQIFGKSLKDKKKNQRAKVIDNLFQINFTQPPQNRNPSTRSLRQNGSNIFHKERIRQIVSRNSQMKLKELNSERTFLELRGSTEDLTDHLRKTDSFGKKSKYSKQFLVTDPNYAEVRGLQNAISGQKISTQDYINKFCSTMRKTNNFEQHARNTSNTVENGVFTEDYAKLRKRTTKRIQTTMLTGRIRQSKKNR